MDIFQTLKLLTSGMETEADEGSGCGADHQRDKEPAGVPYRAALPNGRSISLLKTLLTSACERDCNYCAFRAGRDFRRATLSPEDMAKVFIGYHEAGIVEGLFLSSGIAGGGIRIQDKLNATADILRNKHHFMGYLHLKIMPGAEYEQVLRAMQLADRVSINLEAPNLLRLKTLAPHKAFNELLRSLQWIDTIRKSMPSYQAWRHKWPSSVTQFVAGGSGESDLELLSTTENLYRNGFISRAYFSPFRPVENTPLENLPPTSTKRENHLYQASFLLRDYGFSLEELPFNKDGNLPDDRDPKLNWAISNLHQPIEINEANRHEFIKIPGIGPKTADAIVKIRRVGIIQNAEGLGKIGINLSKALPFLLFNGRRSSFQARLL